MEVAKDLRQDVLAEGHRGVEAQSILVGLVRIRQFLARGFEGAQDKLDPRCEDRAVARQRYLSRGLDEKLYPAGAVHLEDQLLPKKCGHLNDKKLESVQDMATKVAAAARARRDLFITTRTRR